MNFIFKRGIVPGERNRSPILGVFYDYLVLKALASTEQHLSATDVRVCPKHGLAGKQYPLQLLFASTPNSSCLQAPL
ncbi:hypothetical protein JTE90_022748 [Oedothorax gibbosus]|uniref:Uncharacterized protein n=1 Tax=Oedothorax gibbosus TaxID=931172 RepID=A0AAV6UR11_9ARAC|nr:hypothetical protein JTE90_022748 [Oedothorax gibbosus]